MTISMQNTPIDDTNLWKQINDNPNKLFAELSKLSNHDDIVEKLQMISNNLDCMEKHASLAARIFRLLDVKDFKVHPDTLSKVSEAFSKSGILGIVQLQEKQDIRSDGANQMKIITEKETFTIDRRILLSSSKMLQKAFYEHGDKIQTAITKKTLNLQDFSKESVEFVIEFINKANINSLEQILDDNKDSHKNFFEILNLAGFLEIPLLLNEMEELIIRRSESEQLKEFMVLANEIGLKKLSARCESYLINDEATSVTLNSDEALEGLKNKSKDVLGVTWHSDFKSTNKRLAILAHSCPGIHQLELDHVLDKNLLNDQGFESVKCFRMLKELTFTFTEGFSGENIAKTLHYLNKLENLTICKLDKDIEHNLDPLLLAAQKSCPSLKKITLSSSGHIILEKEKSIDLISSIKSLESIFLEGFSFKSTSILNALLALTNLKELKIYSKLDTNEDEFIFLSTQLKNRGVKLFHNDFYRR